MRAYRRHVLTKTASSYKAFMYINAAPYWHVMARYGKLSTRNPDISAFTLPVKPCLLSLSLHYLRSTPTSPPISRIPPNVYIHPSPAFYRTFGLLPPPLDESPFVSLCVHKAPTPAYYRISGASAAHAVSLRHGQYGVQSSGQKSKTCLIGTFASVK